MKWIDMAKKADGWSGQSGGRTVRGTKALTKEAAVWQTAAVAKKDSEPVSVRTHRENGQLQEERTYPRSADRRRSKG